MSLATVLQTSVALAGEIVDSLRIDVQHAPWIGQDVTGAALYDPARTRRALFEPSARRIVTLDGREVVATAHLLFFDAPPVDPKDQVRLPDGRTPPILHVAAPPLTETGDALLWDVYLGAS